MAPPHLRPWRKYQYDVTTGPIAPVAPPIDVDGFYESWTQPVRKLVIAAALIATSGNAIGEPVFVTPPPSPTGTGVVAAPVVSTPVAVPYQVQYQALAAPIFVGETITPDKWIYAWSEPVRLKSGLRVQYQQAFIAPPMEDTQEPGVTYESPWHQPWSEPVRVKPHLRTGTQQTFTSGFEDTLEPGASYESPWHQPWSEPVRFKPQLQAGLQQAQAQGPLVTPEVITADKWIYPWSEPVRQLAGLKPYLQQALIAPPFEDTLEPGATNEAPWHQPWSEPVRFRTLATAHQQVLAFVLDDETQIIQTFESRWHFAWSEPVRFRTLATDHQQAVAFGQPIIETITADKWIYPWSEPVRFRVLATAQQQAFTTDARTPAAQVGAFAAPFDTTRIVHRRQVQYQAFARNVFPGTEIPTLDKWRIRWPEQIVKSRLRTADYPFAAAQAAQEVPSQGKWLVPWSEPVRLRQLPTALQQVTVIPAPSPEPKVDTWLYPFSDPVRVAPRTVWFTPSTIDTVTVPTSIEEALWHESWSEPVRTRQLATAQQQFAAGPVLSDQQLTDTFESRWHQAWSEPVRVRQLAIAQREALAETQFVVPFSADRWAFPWSEPVRQKPGLAAHLQQFTAQTVLSDRQLTDTFESRWHQAWSEPVRVRPALLVANQQAHFTGEITTPEIVTADKWLYPWSEPIRVKARTAWFTPFTTDTVTVPAGREEALWHIPWSEPVRTRQLPTALQQAGVQGGFVSLDRVTVDKWIYPWRDPVRVRQLATAHQQAAAQGPLVTPAALVGAFAVPFDTTRIVHRRQVQVQRQAWSPFDENRTIDKWLQPWSEPVRTRPGVHAEQQRTRLFAPLLPPVTTVEQWNYPWSEPVRQKQGLPAHLQSTASALWPFPIGPIPVGMTSADGSDVIFKTRLIYQSIAQPVTEIVTVDKWHRLLNEPVRVPQRTAWYQPFTTDTALIPVRGNESLWHQPWSEPSVKFQRPAPWYQPFTIDPATVPTSKLDTWFAPLSEPSVKTLRGLGAWLQPSIASWPPALLPKVDHWLQPWSEPVRQKLGLNAWLQQTTSLSTPPFPILPKTIAWFAPLNEPVMVKRWVWPRKVEYFAVESTPLLNAVTVTLNATEVNADKASFGIVVGVLPTPPVAPPCVVSVVEIPAVQAAAISTEELRARNEAAVSTEELKAHNEAAVSTEER